MSKIDLYHHSIGDELGMIHLVIRSPDDPENMRLVLSSEKGRDLGVIFTVDVHDEDYEGMCEEFGIETLEGCVLATSGGDLEIRETPEEPPTARLEKIENKSNVQFLRNPQLWKHKWGRCCCVKHGDAVEPVTPERIFDGQVPWWNSPFTPFQLDLIVTANNTEAPHSMHLLCLDDEQVCGVCGHYPWVVVDEDVPDELPPQAEDEECEEPLCPQRDALANIEWSSKSDAWQTFVSDPHNQGIIEASGLPVERASQQRKYSNEKSFKKVNRVSGKNLYTVKQVFYEAMGSTRSGTWAEFNLELIRSVKGLEDVDVPGEILEMVELDDPEDSAELHQMASHRAAKAQIDDQAAVLENMLDEAAGLDPDEDDEEEATAYKARSKSVARTDQPKKVSMLTAAKALRAALDQFIATIEEGRKAENR
jgi:hypothetical protein